MKHPTEEKIFKLLADPQKLKKTKQKPKDQLQIEIESKFHYSLSNTLYLDILRVIKEELRIVLRPAEVQLCEDGITAEAVVT